MLFGAAAAACCCRLQMSLSVIILAQISWQFIYIYIYLGRFQRRTVGAKMRASPNEQLAAGIIKSLFVCRLHYVNGGSDESRGSD